MPVFEIQHGKETYEVDSPGDLTPEDIQAVVGYEGAIRAKKSAERTAALFPKRAPRARSSFDLLVSEAGPTEAQVDDAIRGVGEVALTKGGKVGDVAIGVEGPLTGGVAGGLLAGPPGAVTGGALTSGAADALVQAREYLRGERDDFSKGRFIASTGLGAFTPAKVASAATPLATIGKTVAVRGGQGAALGGAHEAISEKIDEGKIDLERVMISGVIGSAFGAGFGALESTVPIIWRAIRGKTLEDAKAVLVDAEPKATTPAESDAIRAARRQVDDMQRAKASEPPKTVLAETERIQPLRLTAGETPPLALTAPKSVPTLAEDIARYQEIQKRVTEIGDLEDPRVQALWKENEEIKNRYGGMPPKTPAAEIEMPVKPEAAPAPTSEPVSARAVSETPSSEAIDLLPLATEEGKSKPTSRRQIADQKRLLAGLEKRVGPLVERDPHKAQPVVERIAQERDKLIQMEADKGTGPTPQVGNAPDGEPDILTDIAEYVGRIRTQPKEGQARFGELDIDLAQGAARMLRGKEGMKASEALDVLNDDAGYKLQSVAELETAIHKAVENRRNAAARMEVEEYQGKVENALLAGKGRAPGKKTAPPITVENAGVGATFKGRGEKFSVVDAEEMPDGTWVYVVQDGHKFRVPEGTLLYPDAGTLKKAPKALTDFLPAEEVPPLVETTAPKSDLFQAEEMPFNLAGEQQSESASAIALAEERAARDAVLKAEEAKQGKMFSESGRIDPRFLFSTPVQSGVGATAGALYGSTEGDTPEERRANMLKYGGIGALAGAGGGLAARSLMGSRTTTRYRDYVRELAQGTEGMPDWYLKLRTVEPIVKFREQFAGTGGSITRIKDILAENPDPVPDALNPYLGRRLFPGKVTARIELDADKPMDAVITNRDRAAIEWAKRTGGTREDFNRYFQEYAVAMTAKDYNFHNASYDPLKPASGMTDVEANAIVADAFANGTQPIFEDIRRQLRVIDDTYLNILRQGQLITQAQVDALRAKYPEHIPLQRELPEDDLDDALGAVFATPKFGMKSAGIKGAHGSDLPIADVFDSVLANVKDAMIRAERNIQGVVTANYFEQYPTPGVNVRVAPRGPGGAPIRPNENTTLITKRLNPGGSIEEIHVEFADPLLAKAFNGLNVEKTQWAMRVISRMTNMLGSLYTAGSLDFKLPNKLRDLQEASTTIATSGDAKAAAKIPLRALQDMKAVSDFILERPTPGAADYERMKRAGGFVGGLASSTREAADKSIKHMGLTGPLTRTVDAVKAFYEFLDKVAEDSTRLTAGRTAAAAGTTPRQAALASREAGVDFNLSGTRTKQLGAFYKFINPSVMGTTRAGKAVIRNPGVIGATAAAFVGTGLIIDAWNKTYDPDWKKHRSMQWHRTNSMPLIIGEDEEGYIVFTPPVAQMLRPIKGLVDIGIDASLGDLESGQDASDRAKQIANDSMNPFGGASLRQSLTPTLADPVSDVVANRSFSGSKIHPEQGPQDQMFSKVFDRTLTSTSGQMAMDAARVLHKMGIEVSPEDLTYLVRGYGGGPLQTGSQLLTLAKKALGGEGKLEQRDIPVSGRFIRYIRKDSPIANTAEARDLDTVRDAASDEKLTLRKATLQTMEAMKSISPEKVVAEMERLKKEDPEVHRGIMEDMISSLHDPTEKQLLQMNPVSRARFIDRQLQKMPPEEQLAYLQRMETGPRPIITKDVRTELALLWAQEPILAEKP